MSSNCIITSIQDTTSSVAKAISSQPTLMVSISNKNVKSWILTTHLHEEGIIGTSQLIDSIVIQENVEILGQKIKLTPIKGIVTSV